MYSCTPGDPCCVFLYTIKNLYLEIHFWKLKLHCNYSSQPARCFRGKKHTQKKNTKNTRQQHTSFLPHGKITCSVPKFSDPWHWIKNCLEQWADRVFRFYERYIRKNSHAGKHETTQCNTIELIPAKVQTWRHPRIGHSMWKSCEIPWLGIPDCSFLARD